jgi:predicted transcriptional regulator
MSKEAVFTMKLEAELRAEFMAAAESAHRPASQVMRELMREFIRQQRQTQDYDEYLQAKVEAARASMTAGDGQPDEEVEATFAALRSRATERR